MSEILTREEFEDHIGTAVGHPRLLAHDAALRAASAEKDEEIGRLKGQLADHVNCYFGNPVAEIRSAVKAFLARHDAFLASTSREDAYAMKDAADALRALLGARP